MCARVWGGERRGVESGRQHEGEGGYTHTQAAIMTGTHTWGQHRQQQQGQVEPPGGWEGGGW